jgi:hypothetical protein
MKIIGRRVAFAFIALALLARGVAAPAVAPVRPDAQLKLPSFDSLADTATQTVNITLDSALLGLAGGFLDSNKPEDAAVKELITGLKAIYVRSYTFDKDFAYPIADVEQVRKQLSAPGWQRLVQTRSRKEGTNVDIYILVDQGKACGLALIASEPRQFTIVNIAGSIDLQKLHRLEGQFGIPRLQLEEQGKSAPPQPAAPGQSASPAQH